MNNQWLDILGLVVALAGAILLAFGLIISRKQALKIGVSPIAEESDEQNSCLPHVRDELRESCFALVGLIFLIVGFLLQLMDALPL